MSTEAQRRGEELLARGQEGQIVAVSQLITALEGNAELGRAIRGHIHAASGGAHVIGITGAPGSGKSTLVGALVTELRSRGRTVGVIAVDPSSSLSGGAILGDRIRMQEHALDQGTFVRSMSSRGWLGGVSRATVDAVGVLDATGWDVVIVETVGVGQADVEIVQIAHTTAVVSVPGLGDDIQAIKAGLLEVADIHVVNKADRPDSNKTVAELLAMLTLAGRPGADDWAVPVIPTVSVGGDGVADLVDALDRHLAWMTSSGQFERRQRAATVARIRAVAQDLLIERLHDPARAEGFDAVVDDVLARHLDPHAAASMLIDRLAVATSNIPETGIP
ncbi:MAG: methylmalonyl Co-A mutase-associated GTPase MeaB [Acidimicrobiia bacterium]